MAVTQRPVSASDVTEKYEATTDMEHTNENTFIVPGFTIKELLGAIPAECLERSALHSSLYIVQDVILLAIFATFAAHIDTIVQAVGLPHYGSKALSFALWNVYWIAAGLAGTGIWILGHECGHQAFSPSKTINNTVGWVLHSLVGVPYHSWRISHGRHHAATGHLTRDEVFVPRTRTQLGLPAFDPTQETLDGSNIRKEKQLELREAIGDAPIFVALNLLAQQLIGWPMYLIRNASGQKHYPKFTNHFSPNSVIFDKRHYRQIVVSDIGMALFIGALTIWTKYRSFSEVVSYYLIPYLYVNHWLVAITFLQHTDPLVPHYDNDTWTFAKGALTTIDRNCLSWVGPFMLHGICETHVSHHVSSKIPHYHAWKATDALKKFLGPHYQYRDGNILVDLYKNYRDCVFVEDNGAIRFYKNRSGVCKMVSKSSGNTSDSGVDVSEESVKTK